MNGLYYTRYEDGEDLCKHLNKMLQFREKLKLIENDDVLPDLPFKRIIAASLPPSWDRFTSPYLEGEQKDLATALQFIGIIRERYFLNEMRNLQDALSQNKKRKHDMNARNMDDGGGGEPTKIPHL